MALLLLLAALAALPRTEPSWWTDNAATDFTEALPPKYKPAPPPPVPPPQARVTGPVRGPPRMDWRDFKPVDLHSYSSSGQDSKYFKYARDKPLPPQTESGAAPAVKPPGMQPMPKGSQTANVNMSALAAAAAIYVATPGSNKIDLSKMDLSPFLTPSSADPKAAAAAAAATAPPPSVEKQASYNRWSNFEQQQAPILKEKPEYAKFTKYRDGRYANGPHALHSPPDTSLSGSCAMCLKNFEEGCRAGFCDCGAHKVERLEFCYCSPIMDNCPCNNYTPCNNTKDDRPTAPKPPSRSSSALFAPPSTNVAPATAASMISDINTADQWTAKKRMMAEIEASQNRALPAQHHRNTEYLDDGAVLPQPDYPGAKEFGEPASQDPNSHD